MAKRSQEQRKPPRREPEPSKPAQTDAGPRFWIVAILLVVSVSALYASAIRAPFIFDDRNGIIDNDSIYKLWPLIGPEGHPGPLNPGPDLPTSPRPLVNLSLAVNYFFGGVDPFGYHVFSVALHILTALLLWTLVRRTLLLPYLNHRFDTSAGWLALAVAMLWALHPLVTETVVYATQRSEQMMAFFYLATNYCSLRYWLAVDDAKRQGHSKPAHRSHQRVVWLALAVLACFAGMASKEVMVSAPLLVLLYERTFIAGSFAKALRQSWPLYFGLAASWLLLVVVSLRAPYGTAAGFGVGVPAHHYWLTQTKVILLYLKLCLWPSPLQIHYELPYFTTLGESWMFVVPVFILGIITLVLLWRNHPAGLLGTLVFAILAPTSVIPIRLEMAAERRMYLPLAALLILAIAGIYSLAQSLRQEPTREHKAAPRPNLWAIASTIIVLLAVTFCVVSVNRLKIYNDEMALWQDVLKYQPNNIIAHNNVGLILTNVGRLDESIQELKATLAIKPNYLYGMNNLGNAYSAAGRMPEAVETLQEAVRIDPDYFQARNNLGVALMRMGHSAEAAEQLRHALRLRPENNEVRINLASALANTGQLDRSIQEYEAVLSKDPDNALALINISIPLAKAGRIPEAIERVQHALRLQPDNSDAHTNLGLYLSNTGKSPEAMEHFRRALQLNPNDFNAHNHYGNLLMATNRATEAIAQFQEAVRVQPNNADAHSSMGASLQKAGRPREAIAPYQAALKLAPIVPSYANLAQAYRLAGRSQDAIATAQQAIELAETNKHPETVAQIQQWLKQYELELKQKGSKQPTEP